MEVCAKALLGTNATAARTTVNDHALVSGPGGMMDKDGEGGTGTRLQVTLWILFLLRVRHNNAGPPQWAAHQRNWNII